ncbi:hypothetical protein V8E54_002937 [Elaphomyces granulatus]|jgi:GNAT superfamily N-acetyltransferase
MQNSRQNDFKIDVRLHSASKAARNDPRPTPPPEYYIRMSMEGPKSIETNDNNVDGMSSDEGLSDLSEGDNFVDFEWLEQIDGFIVDQESSSPSANHIGYCDGKLIRREDIRATFRSDMEEPTAETCFLAFDLFDRYGRLKPEFKDHPVKKGSGVWGAEFDDGDVFLIETLKVDKEYRLLGLGSRVVSAMLEKVKGKTRGYIAITRPETLDREDLEQEEGIPERFWRSLGFRRIGSSCWFGLASDPDHPNHRLAAADDYNLPALPPQTSYPEMEYLLKSRPKLSDIDYVGELSRIFESAATDDPRWKSTGLDGNTVLHVAAIENKPASAQWILGRTKELHQQRNAQGETPLDAMLTNLEDTRTTLCMNILTQDVSDEFTGYSDAAVLCLMHLNNCVNPNDVDMQRFKYGCTCGQCISGFLSPRMRFALECQTEIWFDFLNEDIDSGKYWVQANSTSLVFLPRQPRHNLKTNQSMRKGFTNLCNHIATCLKKSIIPTEENVMMVLRDASEWPPSCRNFLERGGTVTAVATMLFQRAMESDELAGDPLHLETFEDDIKRLPICRNDHEFGFVSGMCGYKRISNIQVATFESD